MFNLNNFLKATLICALLNIVYTFYVSSGSLKAQLSDSSQEIGRVEAFMNAAGTTDGFWSHIFAGWIYGFGMSLIACVLLLLWLSKQAPNKSFKNVDT